MKNPVISFLLAIQCCSVSTLAADPELEPISKIYFGSCIDQEHPMPILDLIRGHSPDLFVFLGDNIYADTEDMEVMRAQYSKLGERAPFQRLLESCAVLATWDDHDYGGNDGGASYPKRVESQRQFLDFWKEPADSPRRSRPGIYAANTYGPVGRRVQVIVLDTRYFRSPLKQGEKRVGGSWVPDDTPGKTMLGEEQWTWLEEQLRQPADVRIIASSIQFVAEDAGQETWSNLPRERRRLIELINSTKADGCFFISGDRHWSELSKVDADTPYPIYDLTSSSLNKKHPRGTPTENRFRVPSTPTWHYENYGTIAIDWTAEEPTITLGIRDLEENVRIERVLKLKELQHGDG